MGYGAPLTARIDPAAVKPGQSVLVGIRPAHFTIGDGQGLPFVVQYHESLGTETYVYGTLEGRDEQIIIHQAGHFAPQPGALLRITPLPGRMHVFDPDSGLALPQAIEERSAVHEHA